LFTSVQETIGDLTSVPNALTVTELLKLCSKRPADDAAWQEFVRRYNTTIKAHVVRTFHKKAREESDRKPQFPEDMIEDLVQAVYMRLVEDQNRALERFEGEYENSIFQYLGMISINVVRDYFREAKAQKRPKITFSLDELIEKSGDSSMAGVVKSHLNGRPATESSASYTLDDIEMALSKAVSARHRDRDIMIFRLRYIQGLTLEEIKQRMELDLSPISVGSILNRITTKMKSMLTRERKRH
jgi:RNA polymerase sigma factor (sigma-70 family)